MIQIQAIIEQLEQKTENSKGINDFEPKFLEYTCKDDLHPKLLSMEYISVTPKRKYKQKLKPIIYV